MVKASAFRSLRLRDLATEQVSIPALAPNASPGKRWKFRRNAVIYVAHREGFSQRVLADVFDLPRSRIASILKEFRELTGDDEKI